MRYTLLNRFQGALLGAAIGEILGTHCGDRFIHQATLDRTNSADRSVWLTVPDWGFQSAPVGMGQSGAGWGSLAIKQLRHLLQPYSPIQLDSPPQLDLLPNSEPSGLAIATLPIALFYHENPDLMQAQIRQALAHWQIGAEPAIGVLLVGYTLSLILREQFSPATLIDDFIRYVDLPQAPLIASLNSLQLDLALPPATESPVLLALAAFLKTPESYRLSLLQAAQAQVQPAVVCAIVGALSGAYNGKAGLPLDWYSALQRRCSPAFASATSASATSASAKVFSGAELPSPLLLLWEVDSATQLLELACQLFTGWSGMYDPLQRVPLWAGSSVLAAPHVIRSR